MIAQRIEARSDKTALAGLAVGESLVAESDAPRLCDIFLALEMAVETLTHKMTDITPEAEEMSSQEARWNRSSKAYYEREICNGNA